MNRLAIGEEHDAEEAPLLLGNLGPAPQASVRLDDFPDRRIDGALDPLIQNADAIRPGPHRQEILRALHRRNLQ